MGIDVTAEIIIRRPVPDVAAFVEDPANDLRWIRALSSSEKLTDGPVAIGTRVRRVAVMMGRKMPYTTEVTAYVSGQRLEMRTVEGPFPMLVTYEFADVASGTRVRVRNRGGKGLLFAVARPLIGWMVNSRVKGDLVALEQVLESEPMTRK